MSYLDYFSHNQLKFLICNFGKKELSLDCRYISINMSCICNTRCFSIIGQKELGMAYGKKESVWIDPDIGTEKENIYDIYIYDIMLQTMKPSFCVYRWALCYSLIFQYVEDFYNNNWAKEKEKYIRPWSLKQMQYEWKRSRCAGIIGNSWQFV